MMLTRSIRRSTIAAALLAVAVSAHATPPQVVRYQARLTDDAGVPLNGTFNLVFAIFDADTAGAQLWGESWNNLAISNGAVDLLLGSSPDPGPTPLPSSAFAGADRWLEITVDGVVLAPRQKLASVPYAHDADRLAGNDAAFFLDTSSTGQTKQGALTVEGALTVDADGDPASAAVVLDSAEEMDVRKNTPAGIANIDLSPSPADGTSSAAIRLFRNTNTIGSKRLLFLRGDGTTTEDARIGVDGLNSFFQMGGGNVGIGTSSPGAELEVVGNVDSIGGRFRVTNPNNQGASITLDWIHDAGSDFPRLRYGGNGEGASNGFRIQAPGDVSRLAIDGAGNVGIGTTTPGQKLDVNGPARVERLEVTTQLGSAAVPESNTLYSDSLVKAWASTDATGTLLDGFNLTVTQTGTGTYAYTFRRAMATAVYAVNATNTAAALSHVKVGSKTTTGFVVFVQNPTGGLVDGEHDVMVVGN